eukprot:11437355-Ditylum_brightwellii.AAC.1
MESISVKKGEWVIQQDTVGDHFYIIDDGKFEVCIVPDVETDICGDGGNIVHVYDGLRKNHAHPSFEQSSQIIEHLEKQGSVPAKTKKSKEQAAGSAIIELSLQLFSKK